jgi:hypothetical protein
MGFFRIEKLGGFSGLGLSLIARIFGSSFSPRQPGFMAVQRQQMSSIFPCLYSFLSQPPPSTA